MHNRQFPIRPSLAPVRIISQGDATDPVVTPDDVKLQARIDNTMDDALLTALIASATAALDGWTGTLGRCLLTQTWRATYAHLWACGIRLPLLPVQSVTAVKYYDADGVQQTLSADDYVLMTDAVGPFIAAKNNSVWPVSQVRIDAAEIEFVAGYGGSAEDVPAPIRQAIIVDVIQQYDGGDPESAKRCIDSLLGPFRVKRL